ncbi:MAG TPA: phage portal protein, partial [Phycisphaerae bacterium]|nr:phage portal protein [Phycisphaerae bacterium]
PIVYPIHYHDDLQFAHLVQAQIAACYAILREFPDPQETSITPGSSGDAQRGARTEDSYNDGVSRLVEGLAPGMEITGRPGEKLHGFSPNVPNQEFFQHASLILTIIAVNLDIPVHVLLLDASKTNFSGWRGAVDQARIGMRELQRWVIRKLYRPTYLWKVRGWLATDTAYRARAEISNINPFGHRWMPPSWPYIEPMKDAKADSEIISNRLDARRNVLGRRGLDIEEVDRAIVADSGALVVRAIQKADEINAAYPEAKLDWRELVHFAPTPATVEVDKDEEQAPAGGNTKDKADE